MRNIVCLKKIRFVSTALVLTAGLFVDAQTKNKVQSIYREIGAPLSVTYTDGRVAQILRRETTDEFRVPIFLLENSCTQSVGLKCTFVLPFIRQSYAAVWKNHPTSIGQPLEYTHDKNLTFGNQIYITRTQNELYETILQRMKAAGGDSAKINAAQRDKNLGRLECEADITPALPASRTILFWDENFESSNTELAISEGFGARVNLFWRRYQNTKVNVQGQRHANGPL